MPNSGVTIYRMELPSSPAVYVLVIHKDYDTITSRAYISRRWRQAVDLSHEKSPPVPEDGGEE